jgi:membrane protease YdiL (CAAX protease family)
VAARARQRRTRKPRPRPRPSTWTVRYAVGALVAVGVIALLVGLALRGDRRLALEIGGLILDAFILLTLVPLYWQKRLRAWDLGLRSTAPARAVGLVVAAFVAVAITNALWLQGVLGKPVHSLGITIHGGTIEKIMIGVQMSVSAPIIEEIFFRGLLYRALRNRMSILPAALIAGFLFGAIHGVAYPLNTLPPRMVFGVICCLLYERTGSLYPSMALHGLIDGAAFEAAISSQIGIAYAAYGALGLGFVTYAGIRRRYLGTSARGLQSLAAPPSPQ